MANQLRYRGVSYDPAQHERLSDTPVEHAYRGHHFEAATRHEPATTTADAELHYRGTVYHQRQAEAARQAAEA